MDASLGFGLHVTCAGGPLAEAPRLDLVIDLRSIRFGEASLHGDVFERDLESEGRPWRPPQPFRPSEAELGELAALWQATGAYERELDVSAAFDTSDWNTEIDVHLGWPNDGCLRIRANASGVKGSDAETLREAWRGLLRIAPVRQKKLFGGLI